MRNFVLPLDHLVKIVKFEHINDRCKGFLKDNRGVVDDLCDDRFHVVAWSREPLTTCQDFASLSFDFIDRLHVSINALLVVHGAH